MPSLSAISRRQGPLVACVYYAHASPCVLPLCPSVMKWASQALSLTCSIRLSLAFLAVLPFAFADFTSTWNCQMLLTQPLSPDASIVWKRLNCTGSGEAHTWIPPFTEPWAVGPMIFNLVFANLSAKGVSLQPALAPNVLAPLNQIAAVVPNAVAGINGGYFYRIDYKGFFDDVCWGKSMADAKQPPSYSCPNCGVGDSLLIVNYTLLGSNCDLLGNERPVAFIIGEKTPATSDIKVLKMGEQLPVSVGNAIAAGPNLVSYNSETKSSETDIPTKDFNVNIWEHAASSAIGLIGQPGNYDQFVMATADGDDSCARSDPTCGIQAIRLAYFMKDYAKVTLAMEMDQGGSTTMWVNGASNGGIVSDSSNKSPPPVAPRNLYDGLFVAYSSN